MHPRAPEPNRLPAPAAYNKRRLTFLLESKADGHEDTIYDQAYVNFTKGSSCGLDIDLKERTTKLIEGYKKVVVDDADWSKDVDEV